MKNKQIYMEQVYSMFLNICIIIFKKKPLRGRGRYAGRQIVINVALLTTKFSFSSGESVCGWRKG